MRCAFAVIATASTVIASVAEQLSAARDLEGWRVPGSLRYARDDRAGSLDMDALGLKLTVATGAS
jgi:hypothetical protein